MKLLPHAAAPLYDVVVVGAGPSGLVAATTLANHGVRVLVLDKRHTVSPEPRAVGVTVRQMELFRSWGLEERLRAGADDVELEILETVTAREAGRGMARALNVPTRAQSEVVSPTTSARVPQDHLEAVLAEHLSSLPTASLRRGVEVTGVSQTSDAVFLEVQEGTASSREGLSASYVVAADGAHSRLRTALGIEMVGPDDMMRGLAVEFRAPLWQVLADQKYALYTITHPAGAGVLIPAGQGDRWQFGVVLREDDDPAVLGDRGALLRRIRSASGDPDLPVELTRVHPFRSGAQIAERFSDGRVFLVGDAAHRVTPRGGNGLAMAVRDGFDLGWRLAWVVRGWAAPPFVDTYEAEGRPVVADSVARAADPDSGCRAVVTELHQDLGGRLPHAWVGPGRSTLDLLGPGLTLLTEDPPDDWATAVVEVGHRWPVPLAVAPLTAPVARALGLRGRASAMVVRPDGVPVASWWATRDRADALERAVASVVDQHPQFSDARAASA